MKASKTPALSLILCSRNDQYMGNSRWRLQTSLNHAAQIIHEMDRDFGRRDFSFRLGQ